MAAADVQALVKAAPLFRGDQEQADVGRDRGIRSRADDAPVLRKLDYVLTRDLRLDHEDSFDDELIEGVIGRCAMAVLYGDSNSGKTFLAIEMAARLSEAEPWLGRNCAGGIVVYLATEAAESVRRRFVGWCKYHGRAPAAVVIVQSPINLFDGNADATAVIALIDDVERRLEGKVALVIADTLSRISAGANENSGQDMGVVLKHADVIRTGTGASFLWIHHTGKDQAKGLRGWSGIRAAIDTEIEVTADEVTGTRTAEVTKQRDLPGKGDRYGFRLDSIVLGRNRWGNERTTCVVLGADAPAKSATRGKRPSEIAGAVIEFLTERGSGCLKGSLVKHFEGRYARQSVYREVGKMLDGGLLVEVAGVVALPGKPRSEA